MKTEALILWLKSLPSETISPSQLAKVTGGDPYYYNLAAKNGSLELPHLWHGRNLRIWKQPVIELLGGIKNPVSAATPTGRKEEEQCIAIIP